MEDAWVLSRMMENYEEDIGDGLAAYERFRRPRHRKVLAQMRDHLIRLTQPSSARRFQQHVGTALQNRLLPEIALQQQDWLYEHDVIKGFR
jgi:2-polyprenyl-6-methoxyphenol hydroxylase-like FAD-dependent oxidoreductase